MSPHERYDSDNADFLAEDTWAEDADSPASCPACGTDAPASAIRCPECGSALMRCIGTCSCCISPRCVGTPRAGQ